MNLKTALQMIKPLDPEYLQKAQERIDQLTMPRGSLGRLLEVGRQFAGITKKLKPRILRKRIFTFAADHGVVEEGVSAFPKEVTAQMVFNFINGGAGINVLARHVGAEVTIVDIGVDYEFPQLEGLVTKKVARGTRNMAHEPAMSREEAMRGIEVGIELACQAAQDGVDIIGTGDMGIGNTTASSAIIAAFSGLPVQDLTSRGTGINDTMLKAKVVTIEKALVLHKPDPQDPLDILSKVGGYEIAGIAGLVIGAAASGIMVVIDGFISTAGALIAYEMQPVITQYLVAAHESVEKGHKVMLERMRLKPLLNLDLRLGEGTGAALGISLVEAGVKVLAEMHTFAEAGVADKK
jgi:nicotinate-nucleotide--dimethylbenzimidazole phosphoribosyltransferase